MKAAKMIINKQISHLLECMIRFFLNHPELKERALTILSRMPAIESQLHGFALSRGIVRGCVCEEISPMVSLEFSKLTPSARCIYLDLKDAINRK
jgi:hypothetical protein